MELAPRFQMFLETSVKVRMEYSSYPTFLWAILAKINPMKEKSWNANDYLITATTLHDT